MTITLVPKLRLGTQARKLCFANHRVSEGSFRALLGAAREAELPDVRVVRHFFRAPAIVDRNNPFVGVLTESVAGFLETEAVE